MYRNQYACQNLPGHPDKNRSIGRVVTWENFGDKDAVFKCPCCGQDNTPLVSQWAEHNEKALEAWGGMGPGTVMSAGAADPLKTLDESQIDALLGMILLGDVQELPIDTVLLGKWGKVPKDDPEAELRLLIAAAVVYLSGRIATDVPFLTE